MAGRPQDRRAVWAWALYDWANSAFATAVMAGFFPVFFREAWSAGAAEGVATFRLGLANSAASLAVAAAAPFLGALADAGGAKKRWLLGFAAAGIGGTAALAGVPAGGWAWAAALYALATVGFMGANVFYDALLVDVAEPAVRDRVSALGYALGYLGGGLAFLGLLAAVLRPEALGLPGPGAAVRFAFVAVAAWWALFSAPLARWVREAPGARGISWRAGAARLRQTLGEVRNHGPALRFLLAYWLYMDGVDTVVRMAVDYGLALGLGAGDLMKALLVTQFVGFPAAVAYGRLGERIGPKASILLGLGIYAGVTLWARGMSTPAEFYGLAVVIGLVQGGVQALSRSFFSRLVPPGRSAEFFGFYNLMGKFAAVIGPALMGAVGWWTGNPRDGVLAVTGLVVAGGIVLLGVPGAGEGRADAA
ncbi:MULTISPECIES: MFS transporter [Deferrisoma]